MKNTKLKLDLSYMLCVHIIQPYNKCNKMVIYSEKQLEDI